MKNIKNSFHFFAFIALTLIFFSSCGKENLEVTDLQESSSEEFQEPTENTETKYVILPIDISNYEEQEAVDFYFNSTKEQKLDYQKNYLIVKFYEEQNIVNDRNRESWLAKPISEYLNYQDHLDQSQITILESNFESLNGAQFRGNCQYINIGIFPHHDPDGAPIRGGQYVCYTNTVVFYEFNNILGEIEGQLDLHNNTFINFNNTSEVENDEAKSAVLWNMKAGQVLTFFDSPNGDMGDDYIEIEILQDFNSYEINTFESSFSNSFLNVEYFQNNGLDGKVSALNIGGNPPPPCNDSETVLYEGNDLSGDIVGQIGVCTNFLMNFQDESNVENDEARSLELLNMKAGQILTFYDNPNGYTSDDYLVIEILQDFDSYSINTFEGSFSNALLNVEFFEDNGLDGKVSSLRVEGN